MRDLFTLFAKLAFLSTLAFFFSGTVYGQDIVVTGSVVDETGTALSGVSVVNKETGLGTTTDNQGKYSIRTKPTGTLIFSFSNFTKEEVDIESRTVVDVTLTPQAQALGEVVVTALGISRAKKALGYAVQEISGDAVKNTGEMNVVNALAGKAAGVYINNSSGNVGASSRIVIRGNQSLTGNNQPLFVVDGIPIDNSIISSSNGSMDFTDMGNGAADINPADIANVSILKGGNAAALYGSRGANGVILITTKSGKGKGFSVAVENTYTFSNPLLLPKYQNEFGQGGGQQYWYKDGLNGGNNDGVDESFGPRLDYIVKPEDIVPGGKLYWAIEAGFPQTAGTILSLPQFTSPVDPNTGKRIPTPWVSYPNNIKDFYETGITRITNVALTNSGEMGNMRLSVTNSDQTGMVPNTNQQKNTINFSGTAHLTKKLSFDAKVSYINTKGNLSGSGYTFNNPAMQTVWAARQVDWNYEKNHIENSDGTPISWISRWHDNPYWLQYKNLNPQTENRLIGSASIKYNITNWLSFMARAGIDYSNEQIELIRAYYSMNDKEGRYNVSNYFRQEINTDFLLSANKNISDDLSLAVNLGGNIMNNRFRSQGSYVSKLVVPDNYSLANARETPTTGYYQREKEIHSLYASISLGYKNQLYLDLTGRNDWSSTLPVSNNSYFYPSVTTSWIFSNLLNQQSVLSYGKLRLGVAQVGNDTDPYRLNAIYGASSPYGNNPSFSSSNQMPPAKLLNELSTSSEAGIELKFLKNRLGADVTLYKTVSKNQILSAPISPTSGFNSQIINAGQVNNSGIEVVLNGTPVQTAKFSWDVTVNWSRNRSKVVALNDNIKRLELYKTEGDEIIVVADVGGAYGDMWGRGFVYHENGKPIVDANGVPLTSEMKKLGNVMPDWIGGINNSFTYGSVNFSFLIDAKWGGKIYSRTNADGWMTGVLTSTIGENANGVSVRDPLEVGGGYLVDGVFADGKANDKYQYLDDFRWDGFARAERFLYDASYIKLREVSLSYALPKSILRSIKLTDVAISLFGRNLALLHKKSENFDPEVANKGASQSSQGSEYAAPPSARNIGFRIKVGF